MPALLGEVEQVVLLAVLKLGRGAYAVPVRQVIADAGVEVSRGTVYVTLERLERKGYLTSTFTAPEAVRGGKAKRVYQVRRSGLAALASSREAV
jgi:DNA-binding PadR family transcriptional regulator